jgi:hypothetical protein
MYIVNNGASNSCNAPCITSPGPLYDGGCSTGCSSSGNDCCAGPTGPPGDKYLSYFSETFYANILFPNGAIGVKIDTGLAYLPGMFVRCLLVLQPSEVDMQYFYGTVSSYDEVSGVIVINAINRISSNIPYGVTRQYSVNIDNTGPTGATGPYGGPTGPTGPTGPSGGPTGPTGPQGNSIVLQATANQTTVNNAVPTNPVVGLASNVILGNSLTFSSAPTNKALSYSTGIYTGFSINDNLNVNSLYFQTSGDNVISHNGTKFIVNGSMDISGNVGLGNLTGPYNPVIARLPQNAATTDSYAVRMAYNTNISGIAQWQLFASTSSAAQKANIESLPDSTSILDVRPVSYNPIAPNGELEKTHIGFIAEEMAQNELGDLFVIHDENGTPKSIQYELLIPLYASAMRALRARVADLEHIVRTQGEKLAKMDELDARLRAIEGLDIISNF